MDHGTVQSEYVHSLTHFTRLSIKTNCFPQDWDLNTGQSVRTYPTHGAQISSLALRPTGHGAAPPQSNGNGIEVSVNVGPNFFAKDRTPEPVVNGHDAQNGSNGTKGKTNGNASPSSVKDAGADADATEAGDKNEPPSSPADENKQPTPPATDDIEMDPPSPYDPLFDDMGADPDMDADGESVLPSNDATALPTPLQTPPSTSNGMGIGLALPGSHAKPSINTDTNVNAAESKPAVPLFSSTSTNAQAGPSRSGAGAAGTIPLLSRTTYDAFSEDIMMTSSMDGQVTLIDRRVPTKSEGGVGRLQPGERAPPWCMSVSPKHHFSLGPTDRLGLLVR